MHLILKIGKHNTDLIDKCFNHAKTLPAVMQHGIADIYITFCSYWMNINSSCSKEYH